MQGLVAGWLKVEAPGSENPDPGHPFLASVEESGRAQRAMPTLAAKSAARMGHPNGAATDENFCWTVEV